MVSDMIKKAFGDVWIVSYESPYPPSEEEKVKYWGWEIDLKHALKPSRLEFRLRLAREFYGPNFPHKYWVEVTFRPYGYESEEKIVKSVYGDTLEEVFRKAIDIAQQFKLHPAKKEIKQKTLESWLFLLPLVGMFLFRRR